MTGIDSELAVVRRSSDGRRRYDEKSKRALIEASLRPGVSVAGLAQQHGINANLLRKWIAKYLVEREKGISPASQHNGNDEYNAPPPDKSINEVAAALPGSHQPVPVAVKPSAFVSVVSASPTHPSTPPSMTLALHVRLSNGVELELGGAIATIDELTTMVQILGRMPCSGSTTI